MPEMQSSFVPTVLHWSSTKSGESLNSGLILLTRLEIMGDLRNLITTTISRSLSDPLNSKGEEKEEKVKLELKETI